MNILVIGSGGREHALIWALKKSVNCDKIYAMPGNGGTDAIAINIDVGVADHRQVIEFCEEYKIGLVVVGPEGPLVDGLVDSLEVAGISVFGPNKGAAMLEGSKDFTKKLCDKYNIATAKYATFADAEDAKAYVNEVGVPVVVKADGLAAGKGVIIAHSVSEAEEAIDSILIDSKFGDAGDLIVVEEFLEGQELSVFALVDGTHAVYFGSAQDHKAVGDGDTGPNTGGMGTYSPAPVMDDDLQRQIMEEFINPTVDGMRKDGLPFRGVLFAGFMITSLGPKLLEYNVRFGDPEAQVLMMRLESDLVHLLECAATGKLQGESVKLKNESALCVVMAAGGYPGAYEKGSHIGGLDKVSDMDGVVVFHAGTKLDYDGNILANGGRVLGVTALAGDIDTAQKRAYEAVDMVDWPEGFCRRDIGWRAINKGKNVA